MAQAAADTETSPKRRGRKPGNGKNVRHLRAVGSPEGNGGGQPRAKRRAYQPRQQYDEGPRETASAFPTAPFRELIEAHQRATESTVSWYYGNLIRIASRPIPQPASFGLFRQFAT